MLDEPTKRVDSAPSSNKPAPTGSSAKIEQIETKFKRIERGRNQ